MDFIQIWIPYIIVAIFQKFSGYGVIDRTEYRVDSKNCCTVAAGIMGCYRNKRYFMRGDHEWYISVGIWAE